MKEREEKKKKVTLFDCFIISKLCLFSNHLIFIPVCVCIIKHRKTKRKGEKKRRKNIPK
jgi:hypothetical protein